MHIRDWKNWYNINNTLHEICNFHLQHLIECIFHIVQILYTWLFLRYNRNVFKSLTQISATPWKYHCKLVFYNVIFSWLCRIDCKYTGPGRRFNWELGPLSLTWINFNTLKPRQNGRHFAYGIFKHIFLNENVWISIKISLKFVPKGPINNIPALVQIMAWRRPGDKPLSEPMMVSWRTHICVTRPQWVNPTMDKHLHPFPKFIGAAVDVWEWISISSHPSFAMWLINHAGIEVNPCQWKGSPGKSMYLLVMIMDSNAKLWERKWLILVQMMVCRLLGAEQSPEPILMYCVYWKQNSVKFPSKYNSFNSTICIWKHST